ncbi:MAG: lipoprotein [Bacillales bacterium]|jgi:uncharacterized protein YceK|nr:lipoprotein [Bacillales bacterium]
MKKVILLFLVLIALSGCSTKKKSTIPSCHTIVIYK